MYHDLGNTNYSYMMSRKAFDRDETAQRLVAGLRKAGLDVDLNARHDIIAQTGDGWRKCSGSAYKISKDRAYAHGTMLLTSDLASLGPALRAPGWGLQGNGVESVRSQVANLGLDHDTFCHIVAETFGLKPRYVDEEEMIAVPGMAKSLEQLHGHDWKFGQTPPFTQTIRHAGTEVFVKVRRGKIENLEGLPKDGVLARRLLGQDFQPSMVSMYLGSRNDNEA